MNGFTAFPNECNTTPMDSQEKVLEFLLFDLASCGVTIPPLVPPYPNSATLIRDYQGVCPTGQSVVWRFFDWETVTPADSNITFVAATADTEPDLSIASPVVVLGTASGSADHELVWNGCERRARTNAFEQLAARHASPLNPSSDDTTETRRRSPRVATTDYDCVDSQ